MVRARPAQDWFITQYSKSTPPDTRSDERIFAIFYIAIEPYYMGAAAIFWQQ